MRFQLFGIAVVLIFTVFVTVFAASADRGSVRLLPKFAWVLLCLFVTPVGGILYLTLGRPLGGTESGTRRRTVAPDDDPQFLRDLSRRLRREDGGDQ